MWTPSEEKDGDQPPCGAAKATFIVAVISCSISSQKLIL